LITLRHHLLSIVAIFLALAIGLAIGGGYLADATRPGPAKEAAATADSTGESAYSDAFTAAVSGQLVSGSLSNREVAVLTVPGADEQVVAALEQLVTEAGGSLTGRHALSEQMVDPAEKSLVDTLGSQLMTQLPEGTVSSDATAYDRMGELLGFAMATTSTDGTGVNSRVRGVSDALGGASLMTPVEGVERRAPLVLVVLGTDGDDEQTDAILSGLLTGLARQAVGVVVTGTTADGDGGQLARLRSEAVASDVTTVDGIDVAAGRTAGILALSRALETKGGAFGASGADGPVPLR
jgi:hypothetical protein